MGPQRPNLEEVIQKLMPSCLVLFDGLKRAYEARAEADEETSSEEDDDEDDEGTIFVFIFLHVVVIYLIY